MQSESPAPRILRVNPTLKRHAWPWRDMSLGDVVHVYAPSHLHSKVYGAGAYIFPHNHYLTIRTKKHTDESGEEYIRCEVVDVRVWEAQRAKDADQLAARRAEEEARADAALRALGIEP
jgi:hypothetical protein